MAFKLLYYGKVVKDARSESEASDVAEEDDKGSSSSRSNGDVALGGAAPSKVNGIETNGISKEIVLEHQRQQSTEPESSKDK